MAINFPNSPNPNDTHSSGGKTWVWDGTSWKLNSTTASGIALTDLSVTKPNPTASGSGDVTYNNTTGVFTYTPPDLSNYLTGLPAHTHSLVSLDDTSLTGSDVPSDGDSLVYRSSDQKWRPAAISGGGTYTLPTASTTVLGGVKIDGTTITISNGVISGASSVPTTITVADESTDTECYPLFTKEATGDLEPKTGSNIKFNSASGQLEAGSFKKTGGTASEFLKADGSIDTTTYLSSVPTLDAVLGAGNTSTKAATVGNFQCANLTVTGTTTTVNSNTVNIGDSNLTLNSDETGTPSQNGGITIERGTSTNVELRWNETTDKWQYTNDGSNFSDIANTTYGISALDASEGVNIRLTGTNPSTTDDVKLKAGTNISISRSSDEITISNDVVSIGNLNDVTVSGSPATGSILEYDGSQWVVGTSSSTNNYASSLSWNSGNGVLTVNRSGLTALTVDLDGRYATGTIPTNNNQLTNGAGYVTSSGTITNSEKARIRTDTGNTYHNLVFVDSYSDNQFQVLKVDSATDSLCYNPSANRLIAQDLESFRMTSWGHDYGDSGQFLMSKGSSQWEWSQHALEKSNGEFLLKRTDTSLEGGHLQFEDSDGNQAYAIDVYGTATSNSVIRVIDQNTGTQRFCVNRSGAFGIGHINADYGDSGNVLISQGSGNQPIWGSLAQASSPFATTAQGAIADTANSDIDKIYNQLNAIGNDDTITTVAELKNALLALIRS